MYRDLKYIIVMVWKVERSTRRVNTEGKEHGRKGKEKF